MQSTTLSVSSTQHVWELLAVNSTAVLAETAVHGCHFPGDMAVRMHKVLARPGVGVRVCPLLLFIFTIILGGVNGVGQIS